MELAHDIPALIQRLRSRSKVQQAAAARALSELTCYGAEARQAVVMAGGIPANAKLLRESSSAAVLEHTAKALAELALPDSSDAASGWAAEVAAAVPPVVLVQLLARRGPVAEWSADLLRNLASTNTQYAGAALAAGVVSALVPLIEDGTEGEQQTAAAAIANLARHGLEFAQATAAAAAADGLRQLVRMLGSHAPLLQETAAHALRNVAHGGGPAVAGAGAIPPLVHVLRGSRGVREQAAAAVAAIAVEADDETVASLLEAAVMPALLDQLGSGGGATAQHAALALRNLCSKGRPACAAAAEAGAVPVLVACLRSGDDDVVQHSAFALHRMLHLRCAQHAAINAAGAAKAVGSALAACRSRAARQEVSKLIKCLESPEQAGTEAPAAPVRTPAASAPAAAASAPSRPLAPRVCAAPGCGATHGLRRCGGCRAVRYCSQACSRAHWQAHKAECRCMQAERAAADAEAA